DHLSLVSAGPGPPSDFAHRLVVDADQNHASARLVLAEMIARHAQLVFERLGDAGQGQEDDDDRSPHQQTDRWHFALLKCALQHGACLPSQLRPVHAREKVRKALTAFELTTDLVAQSEWAVLLASGMPWWRRCSSRAAPP